MSRAIFEAPMISPSLFRTGDTVSEMLMRLPDLVRRMVSKCSRRSPWRKRFKIIVSSSRSSAGMTIVMDFPMASSGVYPNIRSAELFHEVIMPARLLLIIASSEESTILASSARACSARRLSVISRKTSTAPSISPPDLIGAPLSSIEISFPSLVIRSV